MENCYSVQGQSDKHIDFGTHEVADISAPSFHYGIIWFRWRLSSVASFRWHLIGCRVCVSRGYLLPVLREYMIINTVQCESPIPWKGKVWYTFGFQHFTITCNYQRVPKHALFKKMPELIVCHLWHSSCFCENLLIGLSVRVERQLFRHAPAHIEIL